MKLETGNWKTSIQSVLAYALVVASSSWAGEFTGSAIQLKIDQLPAEGGIVHLQSGTYLIEQPLLLRDGVRLRGAGQASILLAKKGCFLPIIAPADLRKGVANVEISSLVLDGNSALQSFSTNNCGRRLSATSLAPVDNVGLYLKNAENLALTNILFRNFLNEACLALDSSNLCFVSCVFSNCCPVLSPTNDFAQAALYLRNTTDSLCLSNCLYRCGEGGICIGFRSHRNRVIGNRSEDSPSGEGIAIGCGNDNLVLGNSVWRASHGGKGSGAGIGVWACVGPKRVNPALRNVIASNTVEHTGGTGIAVLRADATLVRGNRVSYANENRNPYSGGISVLESDRVVIEGNQVRHTTLGSAIIFRKSHHGGVRRNRFFSNPSPFQQVACDSLEFVDNL